MSTTRNGKIARLPEAIRRQINDRLLDGEGGPELLKWLNALPAVQGVVAAEFGGKPIRKQNLSEWRLGGYAEWLEQKEALEMARGVSGHFAELKQAADGGFTDKTALWLTTRYLVAARKLDRAGEGGGQAAWDRMRELCRDLVALRRGDQRMAWMELVREKWDVERKDDRARALEWSLEEAKKHPKALECFKRAFALLSEAREGAKLQDPSRRRDRVRLSPTESGYQSDHSQK